MKRKYLIAIGVVVISLAVVLFFITKETSTNKEDNKQETELLIKNSQQIDNVTFQMGTPVTLVKEKDEWKIKDSDQAADQTKIKTALTTLFSWEGEKVNVKKKDVGLDFPQVKLILGSSEGEKQEWAIGDLNSQSTAYYVENKNTDTIYLVTSTMIETLPLQKQGYTDNKIITITAETVNNITINNGVETIELTNDGPYPEEESRANLTGWYVHAPYEGYYNAAYSKMSDMIYATDQFEMTELVATNPTDLTEYGLDKVEFSIKFETAEKTEEVLIGSRAAGSNYYAKLAGETAVFTISNQLLEFYSYQAFDLLDGYVKIIALDVMEKLIIESPNLSTEIVMEHTKETNAEGEEEISSVFSVDDRIIEEDAFRQAYKFVAGLKVSKVVKDATYQEPAVQLTYIIGLGKDNQKEIDVAFVPYDADYYAVFVDQIADFLVLKEDVNQMLLEMHTITKP